MKLLFATTHLPPDNHFGGVVQSGQTLLANFNQLLPNVKACCISRDPNNVTRQNTAKPACAKSRLFHRWGFAPGFYKMFKSMAQNADIVVINGIMTYPMTMAGMICAKTNKPYVVSLRGGLLPNAAAVKAKRKKLYYHIFMRSILAKAAAIHTTSHAELKCIKDLGLKTPVTIVPNGASLPPGNFQMESLPNSILALPHDQKLVLFLGRVEPIKGLDILIKAWADIVQEPAHSNAVLAIAGPDHRGYTQKLKTMAHQLGIESKILFLGMIEADKKWALYRRADFFVLPSYSENFGLVVAEALSCATPVITTTATPWQEINTCNAGRCIAPEQQALTMAISQLLQMTDTQLKTMGRRGKQLVQKKYSWDMMTQKLITVYRCVLEKTKIPLYPEPGQSQRQTLLSSAKSW